MEEASRPTGADESDLARQFVTLSAAGQVYGIDILAVREIRSWSPLTVLPGSRPGARGVLDIRGQIVEVFDLSFLLGGSKTAATVSHAIVVVSIEEISVGLLVDSVSDIIKVQPDDVRPSPGTGRALGNAASKIEGLVRDGDHLVAILDLSALRS